MTMLVQVTYTRTYGPTELFVTIHRDNDKDLGIAGTHSTMYIIVLIFATYLFRIRYEIR